MNQSGQPSGGGRLLSAAAILALVCCLAPALIATGALTAAAGALFGHDPIVVGAVTLALLVAATALLRRSRRN